MRLLKFGLKYLLAMVLAAYGLTIGIVTSKGRSLVKMLLELYGFTSLTGGPPRASRTIPRVPKIPYASIIDGQRLELVEPTSQDGNVTLGELLAINAIVRRENPSAIMEIGTFDGRTTLNMAYSSGPACRVYTLDLPKAHLDHARFALDDYDRKLVDKEIIGDRIARSASDEKRKIQQLFGDSATFDFTPYQGGIELVFIDAAHDYYNALSDSETALKLIGDRSGVILWHDYKPGVAVIDAVETFRQRHPELQIGHIDETSLAYCKIAR